jgi:hypothetical protein
MEVFCVFIQDRGNEEYAFINEYLPMGGKDRRGRKEEGGGFYDSDNYNHSDNNACNDDDVIIYNYNELPYL